MTAIIGIYLWSGVIVIADTRVSDATLHPDPLHGVQKTFWLSDGVNTTVLGFCGPLEGANIILKYLNTDQKALRSQSNKPLIAEEFAQMLGKWIEDASNLLSLLQAEKLQFMLCSCEFRRPLVGNTIFQPHFYIYSIKEPGKIEIKNPLKGNNDTVAIIGSGLDASPQIKNLPQLNSIEPNEPSSFLLKSLVTGHDIREIFSESKITSVGGIWQITRFDVHNRQPSSYYLWLNSEGDIAFQEKKLKGRTALSNPSKGERFIIYLPSNWKPSNTKFLTPQA